ncbi:hypothetical protein HHL24_37410 [Paraburkholderia sp. RP-4-7]|uniref:Uncharacterized protein n=1 Tax=Paraburkholderia polaris TaxID=2728848 RepID=A0A848IU63_9BURK|nr:hypothetical protein [Paraburkholderia polaris]
MLDTIDKRCGVSTWSIALRGSIFSMAGMEEQKRSFLSDLYIQAGDNEFFKAVVQNIATRYNNIDVISPESRFFEEKIKRSFSGELLHFLIYKLVPNNIEFDFDFEHILNVEKNSSIIDIFECLIDVICEYELRGDAKIESQDIQRLVRVLSALFTSPRITALANSYGIKSDWNFEEINFSILDSYTKGNYQLVCDMMSENTWLKYNFSLFEIWARALTRVERPIEETMVQSLLNATGSVMVKNESYDRSLAYVLAHSHAFSMLGWFKELNYLAAREAKFHSTEKTAALTRLSVKLSDVASPLKAKYLDESSRAAYVDAMQNEAKHSVVVSLFKTLLDPQTSAPDVQSFPDVAPTRVRKYIASWYFDNREYEKAASILEELEQSSDALVAHDASRLLINAYIAIGDADQAAGTYVRTVLKTPPLLKTLDSHALCAICVPQIEATTSISVAISLSIHSRFVNNTFDAALKYAFERFLVNNGVAFPLELSSLAGIPRAQLLYFYEHVCTPEVMKLYLRFDTPRQIEEYRVTICRHLIDQGHSVETMVFEVKERTRKIVISDATKHVEQSRIYADISSFSNSSSKNFRPLFERFSELRVNDYSTRNDEVQFKQFVEKFEIDSKVGRHAYVVHLQDLVLNEKNSTFLTLLKSMRDEFTFGDMGLKGFLSTRIRHGHFPTTLRKAVANEGLLSPKLSTLGGYKKNIWLDRFSGLTAARSSELDKAFVDFASRYHTLVDEVNDKWLLIFTIDQDISGLTEKGGRQTALFNYSVTALEAFYIQELLPAGATYSDFVSTVTRWLWDRTEFNLQEIRQKIDLEVRERATQLVAQLEGSVVATAAGHRELSNFCDAVARARTALNHEIDTIIGWFTRSSGINVRSFESDIAVTIARLSAGAEINHTDRTQFCFQGRALTSFVDVLYVLLENCVTKSQLSKSELSINSEIIENGDTITVSVSNNCAAVWNVDTENSALDYYRESYGNSEFALRAAQGQGGSGFFKVWKALSKDLDLQHAINFGYQTATKFSVSISIPIKEMEKIRYHENSNS